MCKEELGSRNSLTPLHSVSSTFSSYVVMSSSTPAPVPRTIKDFFTSPPTSSARMCSCPVCGLDVPLRDINSHLDSTDQCKPDERKMETADEADGADPFDGDSDTDFEAVDIKCGSQPTTADVTTTIASSSSSSAMQRTYSFDQCVPRHFSSPSSSASCSPSPTKRVRASRSISRNPNRFKLADSGDTAAAITTPSRSQGRKTRGSKFSPLPVGGRSNSRTPQKVRKALFDSSACSTPEKPVNHVPLTQSKRRDPGHVPYYVVNFEHVLDCVLEKTDDRELFDPDELDSVSSYRRMGLDARKLYVRLFQRKLQWLQRTQIKYEEVPDIDAALEEIEGAGLLTTDKSLRDLEVLLKLLPAPDVKALAKEMRVANGTVQKGELVQQLIRHSRQKSVFFKNSNQGVNPIEAKIRNKTRHLLGPCFRLEDEPRRIFLRVLSLFSLSNWWDDRESGDRGQQPQQLTTILLVNQGKLTFPTYDIVRKTKLFKNRAHLLLFEESCALEARMSAAFDKKDWDGALDLEREARAAFDSICGDEEEAAFASSLPEFLRRFTRGAVVAYVLTKGVEVLERHRRHDEAAELIDRLLGQDLYLPDYRGHWYERLVLDLDMHLKRPRESLARVEEGLNDGRVREARRLALVQRAVKITGTKGHKGRFDETLEKLRLRPDWTEPSETPSEKIRGRLMPKDNAPGAKTVFFYEKGEGGESLLCSVEEYVREYYRAERNMSEGLHAEGAVVNTLCAVLFWECLYGGEVADAFRSPNQGFPLDFNSDDFYESRKDAIDARLEEVEAMTAEQMRAEVESCWEAHSGVVSVVSWELFRGPEHMCGLLSCLTGAQIRGVCERLLKNHRHTRSGFPDLTLWNPESGRCEIVEVKGPGDRLSNKQVLWIEYLVGLGVAARVCHVEAVGAKRIVGSPLIKKRKKSSSPEKKKKRGRKAQDSDDDFC